MTCIIMGSVAPQVDNDKTNKQTDEKKKTNKNKQNQTSIISSNTPFTLAFTVLHLRSTNIS